MVVAICSKLLEQSEQLYITCIKGSNIGSTYTTEGHYYDSPTVPDSGVIERSTLADGTLFYIAFLESKFLRDQF